MTLSYPVRYLHDLISNGDWLGLLFVAVVVGYVGKAMVQHRPNIRPWGGRIALVAFIVFAVIRAMEYGEPAVEDLVSAALHGLVAGAIVLGPTWIILSILGFLRERWLDVWRAVKRSQEQRRRQREERQRQRHREREQQERQRTVVEPVDQRRSADERKRRTDARAKAQRAFHLLRADLRDRFTEKEFTAYVNAYLGDHQSPEDVEYHATKLTQLLSRIAEGTGNSLQSYGVLNQRFEQQKAAIAAAPIDDELRDILLHELEEQYEEEFRRLIREKPQ